MAGWGSNASTPRTPACCSSFYTSGSAWALWATEHVNRADLSGVLHGTHWAALRDLLPAYQHITKVSIGDGCSADFWRDCWLVDVPLTNRLSALYSHYVARGTTVRDVVRANLRDLFHRRLTPQASVEVDQLSEML